MLAMLIVAICFTMIMIMINIRTMIASIVIGSPHDLTNYTTMTVAKHMVIAYMSTHAMIHPIGRL